MWDEDDKSGYYACTQKNIGQISYDKFSHEIEKYASDTKYKTFLEVGTWNGMGSTKAFSDGFKKRDDDFVFFSLECNKDKWYDAYKLYEFNDKMHILNEVIWNEEPHNFYQIFPKCQTNEIYKHWHNVDLRNMKLCEVFLNRSNLPNIFDVILLDGGEFTTYFEYQLLKNRCKVLMLDDTECDKCKLIVREISSDPTWRIIQQETLRNGYLIAEKIG